MTDGQRIRPLPATRKSNRVEDRVKSPSVVNNQASSWHHRDIGYRKGRRKRLPMLGLCGRGRIAGARRTGVAVSGSGL